MKLLTFLSAFIAIGVQGLRVEESHKYSNGYDDNIECMKKGGLICGSICCQVTNCYYSTMYCPSESIIHSNTEGEVEKQNNFQTYSVDPSRNPFTVSPSANYRTSWRIY